MPDVPDDPFLHAHYRSLHDSPRQQKFRRIRPWPVGVVFIEHPGMSMEDIRAHFRLMRELGFTALKQCQVCRGTDRRAVMHIAIDEGIIPWWYGEGGWEDPTPERLAELGIDPATPIEDLRENEIWLERQRQVMHERVDREADGEAGRTLMKQQDDAPDRQRGADWVPSVQPTFNFEVADEHKGLFLDWLKRTYGDIEALNLAWNQNHCMVPGPKNLPELGGTVVGWQSWEHLEGELLDVVNGNFREYRRTRDVYRFKADNYINWLRDRLEPQVEADPNAPVRAGGEMGLFLPFASRGTDMEGIADVMREWGSFYPSFHPAWHLEEVEFETVRPYYMQTSITVDWFKGGWNASWESTGGPQQMTGHKAPFVPKVRDQKPGVTMDEGNMRQLMLTWVAGGYRGFGQWCWTIRTFGWEGGEFGLLDRNNRPTGRARIAGRIGQTCRRLRDELWQANKEPLVGILYDWDMEAIWAATSRGGRDFFKSEPIRARIGAARALINANVPWEHVTVTDLRAGLAARYKVIVLPAFLALGTEVLELLHAFVEQGGRVVMDAPGGWYDEYGRVLRSDDGSAFERLFGARLADFQFSREGNRPWSIDGERMPRTTLDLQPTTAETVVSFDHATPEEPRPAVTCHALGQGQALVLAFEATLSCADPGNTWMESMLLTQLLGGLPSPYRCAEAIVYRLAAPTADHYFLLNDGDETWATLETPAYSYSAIEDPLDGEELELGKPIRVSACSARWVRCVR